MTVAREETYGQEFRRIRKELGMTQPEAAEACGVHLRTVAAWETGKREFNSNESAALIRQALAKLKRRRRYRNKG